MASALLLAATRPALSLTGSTARRASIAVAPSRPLHAGAPQQQQQRRRLAAAGPGSMRAMSASADHVSMINQKNADNAVMVYSKTYCPYCSEVKSLFERLGVAAKVVELDELADGASVQDALSQVTGRRTVPQVFIGGQHVGGCDDTLAAYSSGKLKTLLEGAGVQAKL